MPLAERTRHRDLSDQCIPSGRQRRLVLCCMRQHVAEHMQMDHDVLDIHSVAVVVGVVVATRTVLEGHYHKNYPDDVEGVAGAVDRMNYAANLQLAYQVFRPILGHLSAVVDDHMPDLVVDKDHRGANHTSCHGDGNRPSGHAEGVVRDGMGQDGLWFYRNMASTSTIRRPKFHVHGQVSVLFGWPKGVC